MYLHIVRTTEKEKAYLGTKQVQETGPLYDHRGMCFGLGEVTHRTKGMYKMVSVDYLWVVLTAQPCTNVLEGFEEEKLATIECTNVEFSSCECSKRRHVWRLWSTDVTQPNLLHGVSSRFLCRKCNTALCRFNAKKECNE